LAGACHVALQGLACLRLLAFVILIISRLCDLRKPFFAFFCDFFRTLFYNVCYSSIAVKRSPLRTNDQHWGSPKTSGKDERLEKGFFELDHFLSNGKY
jgi:hypothetical protein